MATATRIVCAEAAAPSNNPARKTRKQNMMISAGHYIPKDTTMKSPINSATEAVSQPCRGREMGIVLDALF
jgi:hypothetical protein